MNKIFYILILIIMSGQLIEFVVQSKKNFVFSQGDMQTIGQKNSKGFTVAFISDRFDMSIKLKPPSIVFLVQACLVNTRFFTVELQDKDNNIIDVQSVKNKQGFQVSLLIFDKSRQSKKITSKIKITLFNIQNKEDQILGLKYFLVKGEKPEVKNSKKDISKREDYFVDAKYSPHNVKIKGSETIFSQRKKNKDLTQQQQLKKAMEQSRKLAEKQQFPKEESIKIKPEYQHYNFKEQRNYPLVDFDKIKDCLHHVNSTWLQAQKKMEIQKGIKKQHRLSNHIQIKHFHGKSICVDITPEAKKKHLQKLAEQLGAKIIKEVTDNCILITIRIDTQKVSKAKKMKNVKILNPSFIEECKQCDAYLNEREYFLKI